jgi:hypothetical protein
MSEVNVQFYGSPDREGNEKAVRIMRLPSGHIVFGFVTNGHVKDGVIMNKLTAAALSKRLKFEISQLNTEENGK